MGPGRVSGDGSGVGSVPELLLSGADGSSEGVSSGPLLPETGISASGTVGAPPLSVVLRTAVKAVSAYSGWVMSGVQLSMVSGEMPLSVRSRATSSAVGAVP